MTDSLEKILTDDDDFLDARHRLVTQQQPTTTDAQSLNNDNNATNASQTMMASTHRHGNNASVFDSYSNTDQEFDSNGTFRRIQSTGYDSADDEMDEMKDLGLSNIEETDGRVVVEEEDDDDDDDNEEEEAEISQINDNEDVHGDDDVEVTPNVSFSRPKPLKFNQPLGPTSAGPISAVSASSGGAFKPAKRVAVSTTTTTTTPRPQRTLPRNSVQAYQNIGALYQNHSQEIYYPHQNPQHAASNVMFNDHQSRLHLQYPHDQSHPQYGPPHQHHHSSTNFHLSPLPSPQNLGYGNIPTMGVVSPLTLPTDYSQGHGAYDYHHHANSAILGRGSHPPHPIMNNIHGGGMGGNVWWRGGQPGHHLNLDGYNNSMTPQHHHLHHDQLQQQGGMSMLPVPGHTSPDYSYHEMMGGTPPYNIPHHQNNMFSRPPPPANTNYPHQNHHQQIMSPSYHHTGAALGASRPRTKSKENNGPRMNNYYRKSQSPSPTMQQQGSPDGRGMRPRKDSTASANSAFSGEHELGDVLYVEKMSSPNSSSISSMRQNIPRSITNASSGDGLEQTDWFYHANRNDAGSYGAKDSHTSYLQHQQTETPHRVRKGSYELFGTGGGNNRVPLPSVEEVKVHQQHELISSSAQPPRNRHLPPCPDYPPHKYGENERRQKDGANDEEGKQSHGEFVLESPSERQAFKEFGKQFRQMKNESLAAARDYALACLSESNRDVFLPSTMHWRVHLELADVAKRSNQINIARNHYRQACALQPHASQGWLEHSKLEEESGNLRKCASILQEGLSHCAANENLLIMAIKFYERMGELDQARQLLSRLKHYSIDKSWKTMLEGAMLEARAGRYTMVSCASFPLSSIFVSSIFLRIASLHHI